MNLTSKIRNTMTLEGIIVTLSYVTAGKYFEKGVYIQRIISARHAAYLPPVY